VPVVLATDVLVWLLVLAVAVFAWYCGRRVHLAAPWARVFRSRIAVAAALVLSCYVLVGLLDSLHFRPALPAKDPGAQMAYAVEVRSVLDQVLTPLRTRLEKTYSAPLATRLYQKEQVERPDGTLAREFPRLAHGGAHLKDESEWGTDVAVRILVGLVGAALLWGLGVFAGRATLARRWPEVPWDAAAAALGAILALAGPMAALAAGYHVFGTDRVGADVLYQALKSIRTSLVIGTLTTLVLLPLGIAAGIAAG
jgi:peptide/nickel transport system permease protein